MPSKNILVRADDNHVVPVEHFNPILRIVQFILAVIILVFVAVATNYWGGYNAFAFSLFTAAATMILTGYYILSHSLYPVAYNRWAVLGLEIFAVVFWLTTFSLLADWAANVHSGYYYGNGYYNNGYGTNDPSNPYEASHDLAATAAALGAVEFVFFVVTLIYFGIGLHKHRMDGYHSAYGSSRTGPPEGTPVTQV